MKKDMTDTKQEEDHDETNTNTLQSNTRYDGVVLENNLKRTTRGGTA